MTDIVWFRDDFRLDDHPALSASADRPALCIYVHDQRPANGRPLGGAAKWRLAQSLASLERSLSAGGGRLDVVAGEADATILRVAAAANASRVLWTRRYEAEAIALDAKVEAALKARGVESLTFNGRLMREPRELMKPDGKPPGTFSSFWRRHQALGSLSAPLPSPPRISPAQWPGGAPDRATTSELRLTPTAPDWSGELALGETPGEDGGRTALARFVADALPDYPDARDRPAPDPTSRLSAHLRFGELSARRAACAIEAKAADDPRLTRSAEKFVSELGWRDFSYALLAAHPDMATRPLRREFARFPFRNDDAGFRAWSKGWTGYPIVDAGMRQLWRTGFMHNRVRMVAASFLIKHLLIDWRRGEAWFWDTLCDADPANNPASWQWVAGSGADAAPYFRVFNPVLQGETFDPDGAYVRRWVPELAGLEGPDIHAPWRAPAEALARAGVILGKTYPAPIVDHEAARARALKAFASIRGPSAKS
jgi:deoxyribodipyrimidine photo-lyase